MTNTITNGTAEYQQDTTNMQPGQYNVNASYTGTNIYTNAENNSRLTINDPNIIVINCQSTESFTCISDSFNTTTPQLNNDGYITNIYNYFTICTQPITRNTTITGIIQINNNSNMGFGLTKTNSGPFPRFWQFNSTLQECHDSNNIDYSSRLNRITQNTDYYFTYTVDEEGYITYTDDNNTNPVKSSKVFTDTELASMYLRFRHWNASGRIILKQLTYHYTPGEGT